MKLSKDFKEIKGDASFRKFYRNKKKNSIIVFANKEKPKNLLIYDSINKILISIGEPSLGKIIDDEIPIAKKLRAHIKN